MSEEMKMKLRAHRVAWYKAQMTECERLASTPTAEANQILYDQWMQQAEKWANKLEALQEASDDE